MKGIPPVNESPDDADVHFLDDRINEYNIETTGITDGRIVSFFVRDELGDIIAGLYGWTGVEPARCATCGYVRIIERAAMAHPDGGGGTRGVRAWVHPNRAQYSRFQAPRLYERLGFEIIGTHFDYPRGHQKHYLRKELAKWWDTLTAYPVSITLNPAHQLARVSLSQAHHRSPAA